MGKIIIFSAPSGSGKSTIIRWLMTFTDLRLALSVSCTSRIPRAGEVEGVDYYFLSKEDFRRRIVANEFLEYEEVYGGTFYGTLKRDVDKLLKEGKNVVFDVDVKGGCRIKNIYCDDALSIFISPPSIEKLRERLLLRGTETIERVEQRLKRATFELTFADKYDKMVVNDDLITAQNEVKSIVEEFVFGKRK